MILILPHGPLRWKHGWGAQVCSVSGVRQRMQSSKTSRWNGLRPSHVAPARSSLYFGWPFPQTNRPAGIHWLAGIHWPAGIHWLTGDRLARSTGQLVGGRGVDLLKES